MGQRELRKVSGSYVQTTQEEHSLEILLVLLPDVSAHVCVDVNKIPQR